MINTDTTYKHESSSGLPFLSVQRGPKTAVSGAPLHAELSRRREAGGPPGRAPREGLAAPRSALRGRHCRSGGGGGGLTCTGASGGMGSTHTPCRDGLRLPRQGLAPPLQKALSEPHCCRGPYRGHRHSSRPGATPLPATARVRTAVTRRDVRSDRRIKHERELMKWVGGTSHRKEHGDSWAAGPL